MVISLVALSLSLLVAAVHGISISGVTKRDPNGIMLPFDSPLVHLVGRWDTQSTSWWGGSGLKIVASNLESLTLHLGELTVNPAQFAVSVNHGAWVSVNFTAGANTVPLGNISPQAQNLVHIAGELWFNNRIQLQAVELNAGAQPVKFTPQKTRFQFIGDSFSSGYNDPQGVVTAWPTLTTDFFKAELNIQAQPGICLFDKLCFGNERGISFEFFRTEDTGFFNDPQHNFTTSWDFSRDLVPTHVVIHIGANDNSNNVTEPDFLATYIPFVANVRKLYPTQPLFILSPWGWPCANCETFIYYNDPSPYAAVIAQRNSIGDNNVFLVNATGWVTFADVDPSNFHPTLAAETKIANFFIDFLTKWGLVAAPSWAV